MLKQLSDKNPSPKSLRALAATYEQMKEYALAAQALQRALELNPPDAGDLKRALAEDQTAGQTVRRRDQDLSGSGLRRSQRCAVLSVDVADLPHHARPGEGAGHVGQGQGLEPYNVEIRYNEIGILEAEGKPNEALKAMKDLVVSTEKRSYSPREKDVRAELLESWRRCT